MPFTPLFPLLAGQLPLLLNARRIIEADMKDALEWAYGTAEPGPVYERIQFSTRHSRSFPLLIIQPAGNNAGLYEQGGVDQQHSFAVSIFLSDTDETNDDQAGRISKLTEALIRYYDATMMAFISATPAQWRQGFPGSGAEQGGVKVTVRNAIYGQIAQPREEAGVYIRSVTFELFIRLTESR